jgi:hypothetical protein
MIHLPLSTSVILCVVTKFVYVSDKLMRTAWYVQ